MDSPKLSRRKLFVATIIAICLATTMSCVLTKPAKAGRTYHISIEDFQIRPALVRIRSGDTVIWTNNDPVIHTLWFVEADGQTTYEGIGSGGLSDPILPGDSWVWVFHEDVKLQYFDFERLWITAYIDIRHNGGGAGRINAVHT